MGAQPGGSQFIRANRPEGRQRWRNSHCWRWRRISALESLFYI